MGCIYPFTFMMRNKAFQSGIAFTNWALLLFISQEFKAVSETAADAVIHCVNTLIIFKKSLLLLFCDCVEFTV